MITQPNFIELLESGEKELSGLIELSKESLADHAMSRKDYQKTRDKYNFYKGQRNMLRANLKLVKEERKRNSIDSFD